MTPNDLIVAGLRTSTQLIHRMTSDLTPAEFLHQPAAGANCAAWIVGHLALSAQRALGRMGVTGLPAVPEELVAKLQTTKSAAGKQDGYGDPKELLAMLDDRVARLSAAILKLPAEALTAEPDFRPPGVTNRGEALLFLSIHNGVHSGQISTIRRSLGKPPLM
jgi:hypothetical protein